MPILLWTRAKTAQPEVLFQHHLVILIRTPVRPPAAGSADRDGSMNLPAARVLADSAFSAEGASSPRPEGGGRFIVETRRPFSGSHIWQLQDAYFAGRGVEAWRQGEVPH